MEIASRIRSFLSDEALHWCLQIVLRKIRKMGRRLCGGGGGGGCRSRLGTIDNFQSWSENFRFSKGSWEWWALKFFFLLKGSWGWWTLRVYWKITLVQQMQKSFYSWLRKRFSTGKNFPNLFGCQTPEFPENIFQHIFSPNKQTLNLRFSNFGTTQFGFYLVSNWQKHNLNYLLILSRLWSKDCQLLSRGVVILWAS